MFLKNLFEAIQNKTAVLGWGRGMGHKGHMLLAKAVLHHAKENNAKPYFVVSRTSLVDPSTGQPWADKPTFTKTKDDPLSPEEKLATYRKVFPQNAEVFSVATADATKLEQVIAKIAQDGYNKVILVVGEDQKTSMSYLTRPDKSGVPPYKQSGINELEIISRQDTTEPSSMKGSPEYQEGPRATPMRQVLLDPSKSEEEQFAVWRRDMPDQLSDEEVFDLMQKAKQRMLAVPAAKKAGKKDVAEGQLNELDIFAPVTTYIRLANGEYVAANWRRNQDLGSATDSASFIKVKPLDPIAAKRLGLDNILKDPRRQDNPSNVDNLKGNTTIAKGGPMQGTGPLGDRTVKVVDITDPNTIKNAGVPDSVIAKVAQWAEKTSSSEQVSELSKDTLKRYVPARIDSATKLVKTDKEKAKRLATKDIPRALSKLKDPDYDQQKEVSEKMLPKSAFAGSDKNKLGVAGQWRNKGPKANRPAKAGDLVGGGAEESLQISESVDPKVSIVFDKYNPPDKDSIDGWKVAAKTKYWLVGTNKVKKDTKNPLPHEVKLVCLQAAMPRITEHLEIVEDWLELAVKAYKKYGDIELVVCTRHDNIYKDILQKNGHEGKHGYFKFDKITRVATPYYRNDKDLKKSLMDKDKTAFRRSSGVAPDKRVVAQHNRYEYFDLLEKFMIKRVPLVSLNESKLLPIDDQTATLMENLISRLKNK